MSIVPAAAVLGPGGPGDDGPAGLGGLVWASAAAVARARAAGTIERRAGLSECVGVLW